MPQSPGDAIADMQRWIEQGFRELGVLLERHAEFERYLEEHEEVKG